MNQEKQWGLDLRLEKAMTREEQVGVSHLFFSIHIQLMLGYIFL
jgi:hypothetical protein